MTRWILSIGAVLAISGCSEENKQDPFLRVLAGTWVRCTSGFTDDSETMTMSGTSVTVVRATHDTTDMSCGGSATVYESHSGTFVLGGDAPAHFDSSVSDFTVRAIDVTLDDQATMYTIVYVQADVTPNLLYTADSPLDPNHDGTSPDKRDIRLNDHPFVKQ